MKTTDYYWPRLLEAIRNHDHHTAERYRQAVKILQYQSHDWVYLDMIAGFSSLFFDVDYRKPRTYGF